MISLICNSYINIITPLHLRVWLMTLHYTNLELSFSWPCRLITTKGSMISPFSSLFGLGSLWALITSIWTNNKHHGVKLSTNKQQHRFKSTTNNEKKTPQVHKSMCTKWLWTEILYRPIDLKRDINNICPIWYRCVSSKTSLISMHNK